MEYAIVIVPLSKEDGGGFMGYVPDLLGCMSDGDTQQEALASTLDAIEEWLDMWRQSNPGRDAPKPGSMAAAVRRDHEQMIGFIKALVDSRDLIDSRFEELARQIEDIQDRLDHMESWSRFAIIVGGNAVAEVDTVDLLTSD